MRHMRADPSLFRRSAVCADTRSMAYNAELVKQLTPEMQAKIANYGSAIV